MSFFARRSLACAVGFGLVGVITACGSAESGADSTDTEMKSQSPLRLDVCGEVDAYVAASVNVPGWVSLGGNKHPIAVGGLLRGDALLVLHADVCVDARLDNDRKIHEGDVKPRGPKGNGSSSGSSGSTGSSSGSSGSTGSSSGSSGSSGNEPCDDKILDLDVDIDICGKVRAFIPADIKPGVCNVAGIPLPILAHTPIVAEALLLANANVCIKAKLDAEASIKDGARVRLNLDADAKIHACGFVSAYVAPGELSDGLLGIGSLKHVLHPKSKGPILSVGAKVCIDAKLDVEGRILAYTTTPLL